MQLLFEKCDQVTNLATGGHTKLNAILGYHGKAISYAEIIAEVTLIIVCSMFSLV